MVDAREQNVYLAKLAEQAERYDEMAEHMKAVARILVLTEDEAAGSVFAPMPFVGWSGQSDCY